MAGNTADCELMIDQSRAIDNRRLRRHLGRLPAPVLAEVKEKLRLLGDL
jgi:mRNA interferase MazF